MGVDKATLVVSGETLAAGAARVLRAVCDPAVEAGPGVSGLRAVREDPPGSGPLAGFLAAVEAFGLQGPVVLLACDLPRLTEDALRLVAQWPGAASVVPTIGGRAQHACARYSQEAIVYARRSGKTSLRALLTADTVYLDERAWGHVATAETFADVDTPDDLASLGP